jgi:hypothetical protein
MMNELEKSDPSYSSCEAENKSGRSDAESVEPREGTKGNTPDRTRTGHRAGRARPPGLERVREQAREGKKETVHRPTSSRDGRSAANVVSQAQTRCGSRSGWHHVGASMCKTWKPSLWICMDAFIAAPIGRCPRGMGGKGRLGLLRWKIKSSSVPWWRCSMRFTSKTSSAFHADFDQDAASTMRWMHSRLGLRTRR